MHNSRVISNVMWSLLIIGILIMMSFGIGPTLINRVEKPGKAQSATVVRVIDGDTVIVLLDDEKTTVRLLGIDAPEIAHRGDTAPSECGGDGARERLETLLPKDAQIEITQDPISDRTDRYGRRLAYISTSDDRDVGKIMVAEGYVAAWYPRGEPRPTRYDSYLETQDDARSDNRGSWADCGTLGRS